MIAYFSLVKDLVILFLPQTTVANFLHLMIFFGNVFNGLYSNVSKDSPFRLMLKTFNFFLWPMNQTAQNHWNQSICQSILLTAPFVVFKILIYF